ncbi:unnamed protein product [Bathycoccus prasinos]|jgi:hypothetical protein
MTTTFTTTLRRGSSLRGVSSSSNCCKNDALALKALTGKRRSASSSISFPRNHEGGRKKQSSFVLKATNEDNENATLATGERDSTTSSSASASTSSFDKNLNKFVKKTATTFAPSSSGDAKKKKNPAQKGTVLYQVFEVQAYLAILIGGLLAFNVIYPSEEPTIARLMGMWSVWMFTVPSLRARDCGAKEKDALNVLFIAIPLINVLIPFVWKSFAGVFTADVLLMLGVYYSKNAPPFGEEELTVAEPSE